MLPTQFIPEYYRDSKDILNADDAVAGNQEESRPRRSLFASILRRFQRSEIKREETRMATKEQLAQQ